MEFLRVLLTIIIYLNIPMALAMFFFAYVLLSRSKGNAIYFNFGMCILFLALWIMDSFLIFAKAIPIPALVFVLLSFITGLWVMHYFLLFTYKFPLELRPNKVRDSLLYFFSSLLTLSFLIPDLYVIEVSVDSPFLWENINYLGHTIFTIYLFILAILAFKNLIQRYLTSGGIHKVYLKKIIIGTLTAVVIVFAVGLVALYFVEFDFSYIAVLSTFTVLAYIYSILFSKKVI